MLDLVLSGKFLQGFGDIAGSAHNLHKCPHGQFGPVKGNPVTAGEDARGVPLQDQFVRQGRKMVVANDGQEFGFAVFGILVDSCNEKD